MCDSRLIWREPVYTDAISTFYIGGFRDLFELRKKEFADTTNTNPNTNPKAVNHKP